MIGRLKEGGEEVFLCRIRKLDGVRLCDVDFAGLGVNVLPSRKPAVLTGTGVYFLGHDVVEPDALPLR